MLTLKQFLFYSLFGGILLITSSLLVPVLFYLSGYLVLFSYALIGMLIGIWLKKKQSSMCKIASSILLAAVGMTMVYQIFSYFR